MRAAPFLRAITLIPLLVGLEGTVWCDHPADSEESPGPAPFLIPPSQEAPTHVFPIPDPCSVTYLRLFQDSISVNAAELGAAFARLEGPYSWFCPTSLNYLLGHLSPSCDPDDTMLEITAAALSRCLTRLPDDRLKTLLKGAGDAEARSIAGLPSSAPPAPPSAAVAAAPAAAAAGPAGGFSEAAILNGIADFVAERSRQELVNFIVSDMGRKICDKRLEGFDMRSIFSNTCALLIDASGDESLRLLDLSQVGSAFQSALQNDLRRLPPVVLKNLISMGPSEFNEVFGVAGPVILGAIARMHEGISPKEALTDVIANATCQHDEDEDDVGCALQLLKVEYDVVMALPPADPNHSCKRGLFRGRCLDEAPKDLKVALAAEAHENVKKWFSRSRGENDAPIWCGAALIGELEKTGAWPEADFVARLDRLLDAVDSVANLCLDPREVRRLEKVSDLVAYRVRIVWTLYRLLEGLRRGDDPASLIVAGAKDLPACGRYDEDNKGNDIVCTARLLGVGVEAVLRTQPRWTKVDWSDPEQLALYWQLVGINLKEILLQEAALKNWIAEKFKETGGPPLDEDKVVEKVESYAGSLIPSFLGLRDALERVRALRNETLDRRREAARDLVAAAMKFWRDGLQQEYSGDDEGRLQRIVDHLYELSEAVEQRQFASMIASLYGLAGEVGLEIPLPEAARQLLPLVTALASARTAEEVSGALEKFAAPVGTWRDKQRSGGGIWASALVGGSGGFEWPDREVDPAWQGAPFAAVGVDWIWRKGASRNTARGLFASVIDVGNLVAVRIRGDSTGAPDPRFSQVWSPGLYYRQSFSKTPFVWGAGFSRVPDLRTSSSSSEGDIYIWRAQLFLSVDVTFVPLRRQ